MAFDGSLKEFETQLEVYSDAVPADPELTPGATPAWTGSAEALEPSPEEQKAQVKLQLAALGQALAARKIGRPINA